MAETVTEESVVRGKIVKAANYLHKLMLEGNTKLVMLDLFRLGTMGQVVALELHRRLTTEQQVALFDRMASTVATDQPRHQQRRCLDNLVKMHDLTMQPPRPAV